MGNGVTKMTEAIKFNLPVFVVIAPLFIAIVLPVFARRIRLAEGMVIFVGVLGLAGALFLAHIVLDRNSGTWIYQMGGWPAPWGIELTVGNLAASFLLVVMGVSLPVSLFAVGNLTHEVGGKQRTARFYTLFLLLVGALAGMALTNDIFNTYVLVEVATLSCCGLVSSRRHPRAAEAAFTYLMLATLGSALVLCGIGFIYTITGHLNMGFASQALNEIWQTKRHVVWMAMSLVFVGFAVKSALFPLHVWLPDAHSSAPSPASAILSGLAIKGYMICLLKFFYSVFGPGLIKEFAMDRLLVLAGMIAIIAGSVMAIPQDDLKRRLAFSTVGQAGYIFLGFGLMNKDGLAGALFYLASHAVIKSTLFLSAGAMISATKKRKISELAGVGRRMPVTMAAFTAASLGLIGIPLFSGFIGKWYLITGSIEAGSFLPTVVIIAGSVLCATYLFPVIRVAWFESASKEPQKAAAQETGDAAVQRETAEVQEGPVQHGQLKDPGILQKLALILLTVAIIVLGTVPGPLLELAKRAAAELLVLR